MEFGELYRCFRNHAGRILHRRPELAQPPVLQFAVEARVGNPLFDEIPKILEHAPVDTRIQIIFIGKVEEMRRDPELRMALGHIVALADKRKQDLVDRFIDSQSTPQ